MDIASSDPAIGNRARDMRKLDILFEATDKSVAPKIVTGTRNARTTPGIDPRFKVRLAIGTNTQTGTMGIPGPNKFAPLGSRRRYGPTGRRLSDP